MPDLILSHALHRYELIFPVGANVDSKLRLLGSVFILNEILVKEHPEN
jgi:hypothetical protein